MHNIIVYICIHAYSCNVAGIMSYIYYSNVIQNPKVITIKILCSTRTNCCVYVCVHNDFFNVALFNFSNNGPMRDPLNNRSYTSNDFPRTTVIILINYLTTKYVHGIFDSIMR